MSDRRNGLRKQVTEAKERARGDSQGERLKQCAWEKLGEDGEDACILRNGGALWILHPKGFKGWGFGRRSQGRIPKEQSSAFRCDLSVLWSPLI